MEEQNRLYVKGHVSEEDLRDAFSKFGEIEKIWVARNPAGFAFVTMRDDKGADEAIRNLDDTEIAGERVTVQVSRRRERRDNNNGGLRPGDWVSFLFSLRIARSIEPTFQTVVFQM